MIDCVLIICKLTKEATEISLIQHFEADFLWKVSLKILNSGLILQTFTNEIKELFLNYFSHFPIKIYSLLLNYFSHFLLKYYGYLKEVSR